MINAAIIINPMSNLHVLFVVLLLPRIKAGGLPQKSYQYRTWKCVPVTLDFCNDIQYNVTIDMSGGVRNPYTDKTNQAESRADLLHFEPLIKSECSEHLRLLLCSVYLPYCSPKVDIAITACRPLCEEVRSKCLGILRDFQFEWPFNLECSKFPEKNVVSSPCLNGGLSSHLTTGKPIATSSHVTKPPIKTVRKSILRPQTSKKRGTFKSKVTSSGTYCRSLYAKNSGSYFFVEKIMSCALDCTKDGLFTFEEKELAEKWISALSCCCCLLCFVALFVILSEYHKTMYPERTIVFITVSYTFYSIAHIVRIVYTREGVSCQEENGRRFLIPDGSGNIVCATTFLLIYSFFMAQNIWWVFLALTWFLSAGLKWKQQALLQKSTYFHLLAWGVPCAKTLVILVIRKIDVNELTGMCSIGNRYENLSSLSGFILGPLFTYLLTGTMFLVFGIIALFKLPSNTEDYSKTRSKFELPSMFDGIYATLHVLFSTYILSSYFYEYFNKVSWYMDPHSSGPNFQVFLVRIVMEFMIGVSAAIWILVLHFPAVYKRLKTKIFSPRDHFSGEVQRQLHASETRI